MTLEAWVGRSKHLAQKPALFFNSKTQIFACRQEVTFHAPFLLGTEEFTIYDIREAIKKWSNLGKSPNLPDSGVKRYLGKLLTVSYLVKNGRFFTTPNAACMRTSSFDQPGESKNWWLFPLFAFAGVGRPKHTKKKKPCHYFSEVLRSNSVK